MSKLKYAYKYEINAEELFACLVPSFKKDGYRVEEADSVELIVKLEKGNFFSFLTGKDHRFVLIDIDPVEDDNQVFIYVQLKSSMQEKAKSEVIDIIESCISLIERRRRNFTKVQNNENVQKIILREIVKIPCPYCGSLVDQTLSECPKCGGTLGWK